MNCFQLLSIRSQFMLRSFFYWHLLPAGGCRLPCQRLEASSVPLKLGATTIVVPTGEAESLDQIAR